MTVDLLLDQSLDGARAVEDLLDFLKGSPTGLRVTKGVAECQDYALKVLLRIYLHEGDVEDGEEQDGDENKVVFPCAVVTGIDKASVRFLSFACVVRRLTSPRARSG